MSKDCGIKKATTMKAATSLNTVGAEPGVEPGCPCGRGILSYSQEFYVSVWIYGKYLKSIKISAEYLGIFGK
jgi:hypothetical protein